jgi:hypothetical protein
MKVQELPMKKVICVLFAVGLCALQFGCSTLVVVLNRTDSVVPRRAKSLDSSYQVTLVYANGAPIVRTLRLELYYDVQSSTRGNFWTVRLAGQSDEHGTAEIEVLDQELGRIVFPFDLARLRLLVDGKANSFNKVMINGLEYLYSHSEGGKHFYKSAGAGSAVCLPYSIDVGWR